MDKLDLVGRGRTAEVFAYSPGFVLKLYFPWWPLANINYEARIGRAVYAAGIPAPQVGGLVQLEGRHGLIYERLPGQSMQDILQSDPHRLVELARSFAQLHVTLHSRSTRDVSLDLPTGRTRLASAIDIVDPAILSSSLKEKALSRLASLPGGDRFCHGDFHPGNVLMSGKSMYIIDWENISTGNPLADVARTSLLFDTAYLSLPEFAAGGARAAVEQFREYYLQEYIHLSGQNLDRIEEWQLPVAAARLHEGITGEQDYLVNLVRNSHK